MSKLVTVPTGTIRAIIDVISKVGTVSEVLDIASGVRRAAANLMVALPDTSPTTSPFVPQFIRNGLHLFDPKSYQRDAAVKQISDSIDALDISIKAFSKNNRNGSSAPVGREDLVTAITNVQSTVDVLDTFYPDSEKWSEAKSNFFDESEKFSHPLRNIHDGIRDLFPSLGFDFARFKKWAMAITIIVVGALLLILAIQTGILKGIV